MLDSIGLASVNFASPAGIVRLPQTMLRTREINSAAVNLSSDLLLSSASYTRCSTCGDTSAKSANDCMLCTVWCAGKSIRLIGELYQSIQRLGGRSFSKPDSVAKKSSLKMLAASMSSASRCRLGSSSCNAGLASGSPERLRLKYCPPTNRLTYSMSDALADITVRYV